VDIRSVPFSSQAYYLEYRDNFSCWILPQNLGKSLRWVIRSEMTKDVREFTDLTRPEPQNYMFQVATLEI
jgi:hypothetical protein